MQIFKLLVILTYKGGFILSSDLAELVCSNGTNEQQEFDWAG